MEGSSGMPEKNGLCFNSVAEKYEQWRPGYCAELFRDLFAYSSLPAGASVLEIGCGTGKATLPFLERGCSVTALEPGTELGRIALRKFGGWKNLTLRNERFEEYDGRDAPFDLICSATAFHWIPEECGYPKLRSLLKDNGSVALFWNIRFPAWGNPELFERIQEVYRRFRPGSRPPEREGLSRYSSCMNSLARNGFCEIQVRVYREILEYSAEEYLGLLNTYSDHAALPPEIRIPFEEGVREAIRASGGSLSVENRQELYLAKPGKDL